MIVPQIDESLYDPDLIPERQIRTPNDIALRINELETNERILLEGLATIKTTIEAFKRRFESAETFDPTKEANGER